MKRLHSITALFSFSGLASEHRYADSIQVVPQTPQSSPKPIDGYMDGYTYRKLHNPIQATHIIQDFFREWVGQDVGSEEVMAYVQQWNNGRSLRSIRDEIARCPKAQRWG